MSVTVATEQLQSRWSQTWEQYWRLASTSFRGSVAKQAREFSNYAYKAAKAEAPKKGSIRAERLAAFKKGIGLKISTKRNIESGVDGQRWNVADAVKNRLNNKDSRHNKRTVSKRNAILAALWRPGSGTSFSTARKLTFHALLADFELTVREGHRMFASSAWKYRGSDFKKEANSGKITATTPSGKVMNALYYMSDASKAVVTFAMGSREGGATSGQIAAIYSTAKGQRVIDAALRDSEKNMAEYVARKVHEAGRKAAASLR